jgi:site-specific DNA recombinase
MLAHRVRLIFEMFASGNFGLVTISRSLEERGIPTQKGRCLWDSDRVKCILKNETYAGTRYYNRMTAATEANRKGKQLIGGKYVYRDRAEWIAVKVPAIVSQELFDKVQEKLRGHKERYSTPVTKAADRSRWNDANRTSPEGWGLGKTLRGHHEATV